ncbi:MAG: hypothetical protein EBS72_14990 [Rhizobiales bacterium]|nr:hypothetical protein [Hyphomicrobiales bacterium]
MNILFVCDPLASFHIEKDSTFTMMREAQQRGHAVWACETQDLFWQSGARVSAVMQALNLTARSPDCRPIRNSPPTHRPICVSWISSNGSAPSRRTSCLGAMPKPIARSETSREAAPSCRRRNYAGSSSTRRRARSTKRQRWSTSNAASSIPSIWSGSSSATASTRLRMSSLTRKRSSPRTTSSTSRTKRNTANCQAALMRSNAWRSRESA